MRKPIGTLVLLCGVGGLSYWGANNQAETMQSQITESASGAVTDVVHSIKTSVAGRDITATGIAANEVEKQTVLEALHAINGRRVVIDEIKVLQTPEPYTTSLTKSESSLSAEGHIPHDSLRAEIAAMSIEGSAKLTLASGAPDGWKEALSAGNAALGSLDTGKFTMVDKVLALTGEAGSASAKEAALSALKGMPEGFEVSDEIEAPLFVSPYTTSLTKGDNGVSVAGHVPNDSLRAGIKAFGANGSTDLTLADGAPDGWNDALSAGNTALGSLDSGAFEMVGNVLSLAGTARTPVERDSAMSALSALSSGFVLQDEITLLDDGTPPNYQLSYDTSGVLNVAGKLPAGVTKKDLAAALGATSVTGDPTTALVIAKDDGAKAKQILSELKNYSANLESVVLNVTDGKTDVSVTFVEGLNSAALETSMNSALSADTVKVVAVKSKTADGTTRSNQLTKVDEEFVGGFWIPKLAFEPTLEACQSETVSVLKSVTIEFVTGSADLSPEATSSVNSVAAVVRLCTLEGNLNAIVGGHTDDVGNNDNNLKLSRARAKSVVEALGSRGVVTGKLLAIGYGATEPIADNATEEGRANNRRTTIEWTKR